MNALRFEEMDEGGYAEFCRWFEDAEVRRRISPPTPLWFDYVRQTPSVRAWMIYAGPQAIGEVQLEIQVTDSVMVGHVALVVNPAQRKQGWCKHLLRALLKRPEVTSLAALEAHIERDNLASQRCLQAVGFVLGVDEQDDEYLTYTFPLAGAETL